MKQRLVIIQPAIPSYRESFFLKLSSLYDAKFYAANVDFLGVKSIGFDGDVSFSSGFYNLGKFGFWHRALPLFSAYQKGDVVVINGNPRVVNYMLLFALLRLRGIKCLWWGHGWSAGSRGLSASIRIKLMRLANAVLVYTDKEKEALDRTGYSLFALNNGLDSDNIQRARKTVPVKNNVKFEEVTKLIFIGRITDKARFNVLLDALKTCRSHIELNVVGDGDDIALYKEESRHLPPNISVVWHGAIFQEEDIAVVMNEVDAFVYPGSVGLSLIHAFNYGLPAIIHDDEQLHMPEFAAFRDGENGLGFKADDPASLATRIDEFCEFSTDKKEMMSKHAETTVSNNYNVSSMVERFVEAVEGVR